MGFHSHLTDCIIYTIKQSLAYGLPPGLYDPSLSEKVKLDYIHIYALPLANSCRGFEKGETSIFA